MVTEITDANFRTAVLKSEIPMLVFFKDSKQVDAARRLMCRFAKLIANRCQEAISIC